MPGSLAELLADHGLDGALERDLPNDGWSGSRLTSIGHAGRRYVLKRTSWSLDWIVRATDDRSLREAWVAAQRRQLAPGVVAPYLGVARDGDAAALLMPDLSAELIQWIEGAPPVSVATVERVLKAVAALHAASWARPEPQPPWCPLDLRLTLLTPVSAARYRRDGLGVADRFAAGWKAFDRQAPADARDLIAALSGDPAPLLAALEPLPAAGLHGDLKLANVALLPDGDVALIDWQLTLRAPVAVDLAWLLVSNVALLPEPPGAVLDRYRQLATGAPLGDWEAQLDLAWIVGLLLRGWRKGLDAEAGLRTGWGEPARDDLARWCERALDAADRRL